MARTGRIVISFGIMALVAFSIVTAACTESGQIDVEAVEVAAATLEAAGAVSASATAVAEAFLSPTAQVDAQPSPTPTPLPTATPVPIPTATPTPMALDLAIGSDLWWQEVAPMSQWSRKSDDPAFASDNEIWLIYAAAFVGKIWTDKTDLNSSSFADFSRSHNFIEAVSLAAKIFPSDGLLEVLVPDRYAAVENPETSGERSFSRIATFALCLGDPGFALLFSLDVEYDGSPSSDENYWNGCIGLIDWVSMEEFQESFTEIDLAPTPIPTPTPVATPVPTATPTPVPTATSIVGDDSTIDVSICDLDLFEASGECETVSTINQWTEGFVILVSADAPIDASDYYFVSDPPVDQNDLFESPESLDQRIASAVRNQSRNVQLGDTRLYLKTFALSAPGIYNFQLVDQDYVDGTTEEVVGEVAVLVKAGDFESYYASESCLPHRDVLVLDADELISSETRFAFEATIVDAKRVGTRFLDGTIDIYVAQPGGDVLQPITLAMRSYQHRQWDVGDVVRVVGLLQFVGDDSLSYLNPTPSIWVFASRPGIGVDCQSGG